MYIYLHYFLFPPPLLKFRKGYLCNQENYTFTKTGLDTAIYWIYIFLQDFKAGEIFTKSSAAADCHAENYGQCRRFLWPSHALYLHIQVLSGRCIFSAHNKTSVWWRVRFLRIFCQQLLIGQVRSGQSRVYDCPAVLSTTQLPEIGEELL